jgi:hypothetical protein
MRCYNTEDHAVHNHRYENLKPSFTFLCVSGVEASEVTMDADGLQTHYCEVFSNTEVSSKL